MSVETRSPPRAELGGLATAASIVTPEDATSVTRIEGTCKQSRFEIIEPAWLRDIPAHDHLPDGPTHAPRKACSKRRDRKGNPVTIARQRLKQLAISARNLAALGEVLDKPRLLQTLATVLLSARPARKGSWEGLTVDSLIYNARRCGFRVTRKEVAAAYDEAIERHRHIAHENGWGWEEYSARVTTDELGAAIGITPEQRREWKVWNIGHVDDTPAKRQARRKAAEHRRYLRRRPEGAKPQSESAARRKPWEAAGMSRTVWYERKRAGTLTAKPDYFSACRTTFPPHKEDTCAEPVSVTEPYSDHPAGAPIAEPSVIATTAAPDEAAAPLQHPITEAAGAADHVEQRAAEREPADCAVAAREGAPDDRPRYAPRDEWADLVWSLAPNGPPPSLLPHLEITIGGPTP